MIKVGDTNSLTVKAIFPFGYHLTEPGQSSPVVTLPLDALPEKVSEGHLLDVFVYTDEQGELIGSISQPSLKAGQTGVLRAAGVTAFGAFFDWGLARDLLVPAGQQASPVNKGMDYVVHVYYDEASCRLLGSTKLHHFYREKETGLKQGEEVDCLVYDKTDLGFKVLINSTALGLIFHSDAFKRLDVGMHTPGVIKQIRPDGKIDVVLQRQDQKGRDSLEQAIIEDLEAHGGISTLTDKSPPDEIYARFNVSKAAYKKALGGLYKKQQILLDKQSVRLAPVSNKKG